MTITALDPCAQPSAPITPYGLRLNEARATSPRIAYIANSYPGSQTFVTEVQESVQERLSNQAKFWDKGSVNDSGKVLGGDVLDEIEQSADAAVLAYGHCGGCTAALVRDAVELARRSLPVVVLVTEEFVGYAGLVARAAGMPEVPIFALPHPVPGEGHPRRRETVLRAAKGVVEALENGSTAT